MPGRKSAHSASVPLNLAILIAGSAERLFERVPSKTRQGIERKQLVPAFRVVPFLLKKLGEGDDAADTSGTSDAVFWSPSTADLSGAEPAMLREAWNDAAKKMWAVLKEFKPDSVQWQAVVMTLDGAVQQIPPEKRPRLVTQPVKKKRG